MNGDLIPKRSWEDPAVAGGELWEPNVHGRTRTCAEHL